MDNIESLKLLRRHSYCVLRSLHNLESPKRRQTVTQYDCHDTKCCHVMLIHLADLFTIHARHSADPTMVMEFDRYARSVRHTARAVERNIKTSRPFSRREVSSALKHNTRVFNAWLRSGMIYAPNQEERDTWADCVQAAVLANGDDIC